METFDYLSVVITSDGERKVKLLSFSPPALRCNLRPLMDNPL